MFRFRFRIVIILAIILSHLPPAFSQTLKGLVSESQERERRMIPSMPEATLPEVEQEEEGPLLPLGRPTEFQKALDRRIDPNEYIVGPDDKFTIYLWGELDHELKLVVTPEGMLLIPTVGEVDVSDRSLAKARDLIINAVKARYERDVDVSVALTDLRSFKVAVKGYVRRPGPVVGYAMDRVSDVIEASGGLIDARPFPSPVIEPVAEARSSTRNIKVYRLDGTVVNVDLDMYYRTHRMETNPYVRMGDVIHVPVGKSYMDVFGAVNIPGKYELTGDDSIESIIELAGGLQTNAYLDSVEIARFEEDGIGVQHIWIDLNEHLSAMGGTRNFDLMPDDRVLLRRIPDWRKKRWVRVRDEVMMPGIYVIGKKGVMLTDLIRQTGGFTEEASLVDAVVFRGELSLIRDAEYERLKEIPVADMDEDERRYFATKSRERPGRMLVDFRKLFIEGDLSEDLLLLSEDEVRIPNKRETVGVSGRVKTPGLVEFVPEADAYYYLSQAGGLTWNADKGRMKVIKSEDGLLLKPEEVDEIHPGDTVWIPSKREVDFWGFFKSSMSVLAQAATLVIVVDSVTK